MRIEESCQAECWRTREESPVRNVHTGGVRNVPTDDVCNAGCVLLSRRHFLYIKAFTFTGRQGFVMDFFEFWTASLVIILGTFTAQFQSQLTIALIVTSIILSFCIAVLATGSMPPLWDIVMLIYRLIPRGGT